MGRSTIRRILKAAGLPPVPQRPISWQTFLRAHWGAIAGADFFTTEVWTWRGLVMYYIAGGISSGPRERVDRGPPGDGCGLATSVDVHGWAAF